MNTKIVFPLVIPLLCLLGASVTESAPPYEDDPRIVKLLEGLGNNTAANLPFDRNNVEHTGRSGNDYGMRMAYAQERETALYAGGNHNDGRRNDCWEYHLGSNAWHRLFPDEGGDHYLLKGIVMFRMREFEAKHEDQLSTVTLDDFRAFLNDKERQELDEKVIPWWKKNVVFANGMITTPGGGPIMPSHTWDGLSYDPIQKRMLWSAGAGPNGECFSFHRLVTGMTFDEMAKARDLRYTDMWAFDPEARGWSCYRQPKTGPYPDFRGMGQSLEFISDQQKFIWYIAASNVSPGSYQMWSYDPAHDLWAELHPNGGKSIRELVHDHALAPDGEQVIRYSPRQKKLYGFQSSNVFSYDIAMNEWAKVCTDTRIDAHDAQVMIAHDSINDVFVYTRKSVEKKLVRFAIFDPSKNVWEIPTVEGDPLPNPEYETLKGFFHPVHNVYVVVAGGWTPTWIYRYRREQATK